MRHGDLAHPVCRILCDAVEQGDICGAVNCLFSLDLSTADVEVIQVVAEVAAHSDLPGFRPFALIALGPAIERAECRPVIVDAGLEWFPNEERWRRKPDDATVGVLRLAPSDPEHLPWVHILTWAKPTADMLQYLRTAHFCPVPPPPLISAAIAGWFKRYGRRLEPAEQPALI